MNKIHQIEYRYTAAAKIMKRSTALYNSQRIKE